MEAGIFFVFWIAVIGLSAWITLNGRKRVLRTLQESFEKLEFETPDGKVTGSELQIVKKARQGMPLVYDDVFNAQAGGRAFGDSFWYCVGPGPSYFLAIPMVEASMGRVHVQWAVRPLTEERMRGALVDDAEATRRAFGVRDGEFLA